MAGGVIQMDPVYITGTVPKQEVRVVTSAGVPAWFLYAGAAFGALALGMVALGSARTPTKRRRRRR